MTQTTCGNLRAMPTILRQGRVTGCQRENAQAATRGSRSAVAWIMGLALGLCTACDGRSDREPVPNPPASAAQSPSKSTAPLDDDAAAELYLSVKEQFEADPGVVEGPKFPKLKADLEQIANGAVAKPMRANAALLLGAMMTERGGVAQAAGYYEHAATLIPDDAGPFMALAVAHASAKNFSEAVKAQEDAARLDPDNLENWLALGELRMRAGDQDGSVQAYLAYEKRRKGLIDGLTLHDDQGNYVVSVDDRVGCAEALAAAADQGTAVALIYSLRSDPEAAVRAAVAGVMGLHRLESYRPALETQKAEENDPQVKEAVEWALAEIAKAPVTMDPTERPRLADDDPRATDGELPRAEAPPVAPTKSSTLAPAGTTVATPGATAPAAGAEADAGATPSPAGEAPEDSATPDAPAPSTKGPKPSTKGPKASPPG